MAVGHSTFLKRSRVSIEEVRTLVAERQRYDDWLSALEARRGDTSSRVYERVRGDYAGRRTAVLTKLHEHVGALERFGGDLSQRVSDLTGTLDALEDERMEAMIRNAVGEYDNDRWESLRVKVEREISTLTADRATVQVELREIHELLEHARPVQGAERPPIVAAEPEPASVPATPTPASVAPEVVRAEAVVESPLDADVALDGPDRAMPTVAAATDVGHFTSAEVAEPASRRAVVEPAPATLPSFGGEEVDDALALFVDTPVLPKNALPAPLDDIEVDDGGLTTDVVAMTTSTSAASEARAVPPVDLFDDLAFLRSVIEPVGAQPVVPATRTPPAMPSAPPGEPTKTLRCTECGTMNLPTEWYCERCGGELAAF
jgi:hypothetical protein